MASLADVSRTIMNSARATPKLDPVIERALLAKHQIDGDKAAVDRVAAANLRVVISAANALRGYGLPLDDLVQEGCCGVMLAARKFDPDKEVPFGAYARLSNAGSKIAARAAKIANPAEIQDLCQAEINRAFETAKGDLIERWSGERVLDDDSGEDWAAPKG